MITKFEKYENGKFINVHYKIIKYNYKTDKPELLVTDFKIISYEDNKVKIKGKGFELKDNNEFKNKKIWVEFDDFKDDKTRIVWNKHFENGSKRIKVYN